MSRDELTVRVREFTARFVDPAVVNTVSTDLLALVDEYADAERERLLTWAADECHREARWRRERQILPHDTGSAAASKMEKLFRSAARDFKEEETS